MFKNKRLIFADMRFARYLQKNEHFFQTVPENIFKILQIEKKLAGIAGQRKMSLSNILVFGSLISVKKT